MPLERLMMALMRSARRALADAAMPAQLRAAAAVGHFAPDYHLATRTPYI